MTCNSCTSSSPLMSGMLISGALMGMGIFAVDMFLRPQFAVSQVMELLLFAIEGVVCDIIYGLISDTRDSSGGFGKNVTINKSLFAGATIWVSDLFLRPAFFGGAGMEILKFLIQGILVMMVFGYSKS